MLDLEPEILAQYESAHDFSDTEIVVAYPQEIIYWPKSAVTHFGYSERSAIGQDLSLIFPNGLMKDLIDAEFLRQSDAMLAHKELSGKRVAHGGLVEVTTSKGIELRTKCSFYPLVIGEVLHLVLFFGIEEGSSDPLGEVAPSSLDSPFSSNNVFVYGSQWILFLWKTQPILLATLTTLGIGVLGIWKAEGLSKAFREIIPIAKPIATPSPLSDGTVIDVDKEGNRTIRFGH